MHFTQGARWHTMTIVAFTGIFRGLLATWRIQTQGGPVSVSIGTRSAWCQANNAFAEGETFADVKWKMEQGTICLPLRREMASDLIAAWTSDLIAEWNAAIESQSAIQSLFLRFSAIQSLSTHFRRLFFSAIMRSHRSQRSNRCFYWFSAIQSLSTHFRRLFLCLWRWVEMSLASENNTMKMHSPLD